VEARIFAILMNTAMNTKGLPPLKADFFGVFLIFGLYHKNNNRTFSPLSEDTMALEKPAKKRGFHPRPVFVRNVDQRIGWGERSEPQLCD
jgi:hypothetical protein